MQIRFVKIVIYAPIDNAQSVREALAKAGAGGIGRYDFCSFSVKGVGRFRALKGAKPFIGEIGQVEEVEEERIETICQMAKLDDVLKAVKAVHPYEEPAIDFYPLMNDNY